MIINDDWLIGICQQELQQEYDLVTIKHYYNRF